MSRFSGKCDLCDSIMMSKSHDMGSYKTSDPMEAFEAFKEATGGVIYQSLPIKLTESNIEAEIKKVNNPNFLSMTVTETEIPDKRRKDGKRIKKTYTYNYFGREYSSLEKLNKNEHPMTTVEIKFDTILDLIPYFPYIVCFECGSDGHRHIEISQESYVDTEAAKFREWGYESRMTAIYRKELQEFYREVVLHYLNPEGREITETLDVFGDNGDFYVNTSNSIDYNFDIKVIKNDDQYLYTSPKCVDYEKGLVSVNHVFVDPIKVGSKITLSYVKKEPYKLYLD